MRHVFQAMTNFYFVKFFRSSNIGIINQSYALMLFEHNELVGFFVSLHLLSK